jgi:predicted small secreted protein
MALRRSSGHIGAGERSRLEPFHQNNLNPTKPMTTLFKQIVVLLFISALVAVVGLGCQTAHGFGKDMQNAGEGIQKGTK